MNFFKKFSFQELIFLVISFIGLLILFYAKINDGLYADQGINFRGIYGSVITSFKYPDLSLWIPRLPLYRLYLGLLSIIPINIIGWGTQLVYTLIFIHLLLITSGLSLFVSKLFNVKNLSWVFTILCFGFTTNSWSLITAEELVGILFFVVTVFLLEKGISSSSQNKYSFYLSLIALMFFLVKGITVIYILPIVYLLNNFKFDHIIENHLRAFGYFSFWIVILFLTTNELHWMYYMAKFQNQKFSFLYEFSDLYVLLKNTYAPVSFCLFGLYSIGTLYRKELKLFCYIALTIGCAFFIDMIQAKPWAYHLATLFWIIALACFLARKHMSINLMILLLIGANIEILTKFNNNPISMVMYGKNMPAGEFYKWELTDLPGAGPNEEVLALTDAEHIRIGQPVACGYQQALPIQRMNYDQAMKFAPSKKFYECALKFEGMYIIYFERWLDLRRKGYQQLADKLCREYEYYNHYIIKRRDKVLDKCPAS